MRLELARALGEDTAASDASGLIAFDSERTQHVREGMLTRHAGEQALQDLRLAPPELQASEGSQAPEAGASGGSPGGLYRQMFERIVQHHALPAAAKQLLTAQRTRATRDCLLDKAGALNERVETGRIQRVENARGQTVSTTLALDAISAQPPPLAARTPVTKSRRPS